MSNDRHRAVVTTVASFPEHFFLENLAVRADGSILVTVPNHHQLWCVPAPTGQRVGAPVLVHTFDDLPMGIVETESDVFHVGTALHPTVQRVDLNGWTAGDTVRPSRVASFDDGTATNGSCLLAPGSILLADSLLGAIWRVDLAENGGADDPTIWLQHPSMAPDPGNGLTSLIGAQPGINGLRYSPRTRSVYYTSSAQKLLARISVDPATLQPAGEPVVIVSDFVGDDFCVDDVAGVAYVTTHTDNTVVAVAIDAHDDGGSPPVAVAGDPFDEQVVGPSSAAWVPGAAGRVAYVTTDGGHTALEYGREQSDGRIRPARLLRLDLRDGSTTSARRTTGVGATSAE